MTSQSTIEKPAQGNAGQDRPVGRPQKSASAGASGYQGVRRKTNDPVFEAKRTDYEKKLTALDKDIGTVKPRLTAIAEEIRALSGNDVNAELRTELRTKIQYFRSEKERVRGAKEPVFQKLLATQEALKSKMDELHSAKERAVFKKPEDIDRRIEQMEAQMESGTLKLIDEKKLVAEISKLRKTRRGLDAFGSQEAGIQELRKACDGFRAVLGEKDRELRAFDDQLRVVNADLTKLSSARSENQGKISKLMKEGDGLREKMNGFFAAKNAAYGDFRKAQDAHAVWAQGQRVKWEEENVRRDIDQAVRSLETELRKLEMPACHDQMEQCLNIQTYLRAHVLKEPVLPGAGVAVHDGSSVPSQRQVEKVSEDMILKKAEVADPYSMAAAKPASGKRRAGPRETPVGSGASAHAIKLPFWVISALEDLKVPMVTNVEEARQAVQALDKVKTGYEAKQKAKLSSVDSERAKLQARIDKEKARLDTIPEEAQRRMKAHAAAKRELAQKTDTSHAESEADHATASSSVAVSSDPVATPADASPASQESLEPVALAAN